MPRAVSLDVETHGKAAWLPPQSCFTPRRMSFVDGVSPPHQLVSCSLTFTPPVPSWSAASLASLRPGPTMVLPFVPLPPARRPHPALSASCRLPPSRSIELLCQHLATHDTLIGMNLGYDIAVLRAHSPALRSVLFHRSHLLIDLSYVNFLECDSRPERSLKTISPLLATHVYRSDEKTTRYSCPIDLFSYNGEDTHTAILNIAALASRILLQPPSAKLSSFCLSLFSDTIWDCIEMTENGVPFHRPSLLSLATRLASRATRATRICANSSLLLSGPGSEKSRLSFLTSLIDSVPSLPSSSLQFTPNTHELSLSESNRDLIVSNLSPSSRGVRLCSVWNSYVHDTKLLSTYLLPLLWSKSRLRNKHLVRTSLLVPQETHPCSSLSSLPPLPEIVSSFIPSTSPTSSASPPPPPPPTSTSLPAPTPSASSLPKRRSRSSSLRHPPNHDVWLSHPSWFIVPTASKDDSGSAGGTLQSRITCKDAAHQTDPPPIEDCRRSRFLSGCLLSMDLVQIELCVPALLCGEPFFLSAFTSGLDLHSRAAIRIWSTLSILDRYPALRPHPSSPELWKKLCPAFAKRERRVGKRVNFAHLFRSGAETMQTSVHKDIGELLPLSLFENIVASRATDLPVLWSWQESLIAEARSTGRVLLPLTGQSRSFRGGDKYDVSEIVNFPVQTTASNVARRFQTLIHSEIHRRRLSHLILPFLNVYDAIKFDCASHTHASLLRSEIIPAAHHTLCTSDYWHMLQSHFSRTVPLSYEIELKAA